MNHPQLQELVASEPWRQGAGQPANALDPTWEPGPDNNLCGGVVEHEPGTKWWVCQSCGYVGSAYTHHHQAAKDPKSFLFESIEFFLERRGRTLLSWQAMAFVAATALRYAAVAPNLREYAAKLVIR